MKKMVKRVISLAVTAAVSAALLVGCGSTGTASSSKAALTMGSTTISMDEANFYTYIMKSQYEAYYGTEIWDMEVEDGVTFGDSMKEMVNDTLVQMLILNSKADDYGVSLTDDDNTAIDEYIASFKSSVTEEEMAEEGITEDVIRSVVEKSYIASYVYDAMMAEEEVDVTDEQKEDAVCIKVQHILISTTDTTTTDADGNTVDMSEDEIAAYKEEQKALAESVLEKAKDGEDFEALSEEYTAENAGFEFSFDKTGFDPINYSYMVEEFYTAAWELKEGEISGLVESDYGYHIIKCISLNDEEATEANLSMVIEDLQATSLDEKITQLVEDAEYKVSSDWENYKIVSETSDETEAETNTEASETSVETAAETVAETSTEASEE